MIKECGCLALIIAIVFLFVVMFIEAEHGYRQDMYEDYMHDNCPECTFYRMLHKNDVAFAIREKRRSERAARQPISGACQEIQEP